MKKRGKANVDKMKTVKQKLKSDVVASANGKSRKTYGSVIERYDKVVLRRGRINHRRQSTNGARQKQHIKQSGKKETEESAALRCEE